MSNDRGGRGGRGGGRGGGNRPGGGGNRQGSGGNRGGGNRSGGTRDGGSGYRQDSDGKRISGGGGGKRGGGKHSGGGHKGRGPRRNQPNQQRLSNQSHKPAWARRDMSEKDFYTEKQEDKPARYTCPHCREENEYPVRWMRRTKKDKLPPGATEEDKTRFAQARSYMVRVDELLACRNIHCRKRFDVPTHQTVVLLD